MSVIGRLDEQVSEKLIEPLARKNQQDADEQEGETSRGATESESNSGEKRAERKDLPIWLL